MKYLLFILNALSFSELANSATLAESCPYGYRNVVSSSLYSQSTCNAVLGSQKNVYLSRIFSDCSEFGTGYRYEYVTSENCAATSSDDTESDGCYSESVGSSGYCEGELKECETYNGFEFTLESTKNCGDYCTGSNSEGRGTVHACTDDDSDYDRGQSTGTEQTGSCAACPDSTDDFEYVGRDDGNNSCYTAYEYTEDGTSYSVSHLCYDENGDAVTQDGAISYDCDLTPEYCSDSGSGTEDPDPDPDPDNTGDSGDSGDSGTTTPDPTEDDESSSGGSDEDTDVTVGDSDFTQEEFDSNEEKVTAAKAKYLESLEDLSKQFKDYFDFGSGANSPFYEDKETVMGGTVDFGLARFSGLFDLLPAIIMFMATVMSAMIIFGGNNK